MWVGLDGEGFLHRASTASVVFDSLQRSSVISVMSVMSVQKFFKFLGLVVDCRLFPPLPRQMLAVRQR